MGLFASAAAGVVTAVLFLFFGFEPWVAVAAGVAWLGAAGVALKYGHYSFGTHANTDLMIVVAGLGVAAAFVVPKYVARSACGRAQQAVDRVAAAQRDWRQAHGGYAAELSALPVVVDAPLAVQLQAGDAGFVVTATHPRCLGDADAPRVFFADAGAWP